MTSRTYLSFLALLVGLFAAKVLAETTPLTQAQRNDIAYEAAIRLQGTNVDNNSDLQASILKVLETTRGTSKFLRLVKQFHMTDQDEGLLDLALANPANETGVESVRLILAHNSTNLLTQTLRSTNFTIAAKTAEALGNSTEKKAVPLLLPIATNLQFNIAVRKSATRALAQTGEGATNLVEVAERQKLPDDLRFTAAMALNAARWEPIKTRAASILPLPVGQNAKPLPPTAELLTMKGDAALGKAVFLRAQPGCATCHRVQGEGAQIGPDLSLIGTKLGKDAIIESILDPSAGISVGYESFTLQLKSGDEAYGLLVSDSAEEVAMKDLKGIVTHYKKSDIISRKQSKTSIMPTGLQQAMTTQEFVDLVEFLAGLKK